MKNIFLLLLLFTGIVKAQIVDIPDANFKAKLLEANTSNSIAYSNGFPIQIDANNDGEIENSEAVVVDSLAVSTANISSLIGISTFSNLIKLSCSSNTLTELDVSSLTNLKFLVCGANQLTSLDVSMLSNLEYLQTSGNLNLSSLNVSGLGNLKDLICGDSGITTINLSGLVNLRNFTCDHSGLNDIDVSNLPNLYYFDIDFNPVSSLNMSNLNNLTFLRCSYNQITSLNLNNLPSLEFLECNGNQLTSLDISQFSNLTQLYCESNLLTILECSANPLSYLSCGGNPLLQSLFVKNGTIELFPSLTGCTSLAYVCADEAEMAFFNNAIIDAGLTGVEVNSYCSFLPGGNYNTIAGNVKFDTNNNGCGEGDITPNNIRVNINDGTTTGASYLYNTGNYRFYTQAGSFDITPSIENPTWFTFSPATATIPFVDNNNNNATQDFCIAANGFHPDIEVVVSPVFFARPGFDATYQITYRNKGNQTVSGTANLIFDDSRTDFVSANPLVDHLAVNSLSWNYSNLSPFESRTINVTLNVNSPTEIPAVNIGDILNFEANINPLIGDESPADNTFIYNQTVVGSYDPNNIICLEGDVVPATEIGKYLHYAINFENTGTFPAENVVVKTEIDLLKFDIGSLQLMNTNFPVDARIAGNKVEFIFENIQLPIGGHGHILLKVKTQNSLVTGDAVANRGDIFFDYNAPIDTGFANTVFESLLGNDDVIHEIVSIYPNPTSAMINIKCVAAVQSITLYDIQGRVLTTQKVGEKHIAIDLTEKAKGIYFLKIVTSKGSSIKKVMKE